jgi:hypothetical protein
MTESSVNHAFSLWRHFINLNSDSDVQGLIVIIELQSAFSAIVADAPLAQIFDIGGKHGFAPVSITNILALHGGYPKMLQEGFLKRANCRFLDSLYHPTFPSLKYNTNNQDINAPWITLSAQEVLLDMALKNFVVVEYGSGMSTFFFSRESKQCYSFEDDEDPAGKGSWTNQMLEQASKQNLNLNLITPDESNILPDNIIANIWQKHGANLLVSIDGIDRSRHFTDWVEYILSNRYDPIVLLVDNTDIGFHEQFALLASSGASIFHHYGNIYGQLTTKQCTTYCTTRPDLLVSKSSSPADHDKRWGQMNFQS